jgi:hypothetical protein
MRISEWAQTLRLTPWAAAHVDPPGPKAHLHRPPQRRLRAPQLGLRLQQSRQLPQREERVGQPARPQACRKPPLRPGIGPEPREVVSVTHSQHQRVQCRRPRARRAAASWPCLIPGRIVPGCAAPNCLLRHLPCCSLALIARTGAGPYGVFTPGQHAARQPRDNTAKQAADGRAESRRARAAAAARRGGGNGSATCLLRMRKAVHHWRRAWLAFQRQFAHVSRDDEFFACSNRRRCRASCVDTLLSSLSPCGFAVPVSAPFAASAAAAAGTAKAPEWSPLRRRAAARGLSRGQHRRQREQRWAGAATSRRGPACSPRRGGLQRRRIGWGRGAAIASGAVRSAADWGAFGGLSRWGPYA